MAEGTPRPHRRFMYWSVAPKNQKEDFYDGKVGKKKSGIISAKVRTRSKPHTTSSPSTGGDGSVPGTLTGRNGKQTARSASSIGFLTPLKWKRGFCL